MPSDLVTPADPQQTYRSAPPPAAPEAGDASLVFIYPTGPLMGTRYRLEDACSVIGRTEECQVRNTDGSVSRAHARIDRTPDGYAVTDLDSTNGTYVNNVLRTTARLADGDYLRIGNCIYRFLAGGNIEGEYHEEIYRLTIIDGLTQLYNRRYLLDFLERELSRSIRHHRPLAVALLDIDWFKGVNDRYGHLAGDTVLRELAALARGQVRGDELLARYGGEEFALVLAETDCGQAVATCDRLRQAVAAHPFVLNGEPVSLTVSVGVAATTGEPGLTGEQLLTAADAKLYQAKADGRDRVAS